MFFFSVSDCKDRWKNLRGSYTRHLKYENAPSGSAAKKKKAYYLAEYMTFLLPYTKSRQMKSNIVRPLSDGENSDNGTESEVSNDILETPRSIQCETLTNEIQENPIQESSSTCDLSYDLSTPRVAKKIGSVPLKKDQPLRM